MTANDFDGVRMVVTGGASGIGHAIASQALSRGAAVAVLDVEPSGAPAGALAYKADVTDDESVARAVDEAAAAMGGLDVVVNIVQRGRCSPAELNAELAGGSGRGTRLPREVLLEVSDGVRSVAEADARAIAQRSGLPAPLWNAKLYDRCGRFIAMPDAWFDDVGMAWEIDSREFHLSPTDCERTLERRSAMMAEGIVVLHTLPKKLTHRTDATDELRRTYATAARSPRPQVAAIPEM